MHCVIFWSLCILGVVQVTHQYALPFRTLCRHQNSKHLCAKVPIARKSLHDAPAAIDEMMTIREQAIHPIPLSLDPLLPMVKQAAKSADMRKAASVTALRVGHLTEVTQFVILIEASNNRQLQALSDAIEEDLRSEFRLEPYIKEEVPNSGWFVLDYGSMLVHVMTPAMKAFYKLEKRWLRGEVVDLSAVLTPASARGAAQAYEPLDDAYSWEDELTGEGAAEDTEGAYLSDVEEGEGDVEVEERVYQGDDHELEWAEEVGSEEGGLDEGEGWPRSAAGVRGGKESGRAAVGGSGSRASRGKVVGVKKLLQSMGKVRSTRKAAE